MRVARRWRFWLAGTVAVLLLAGGLRFLGPERTPDSPGFSTSPERVSTERAPAALPKPETLGIVLPPSAVPVSPQPKPRSRKPESGSSADEVKSLEQKGILAY